MAKTKAKAKAKKAIKKGERNTTPKLTNCPFMADMTRPHPTESSGKLATKLSEFLPAKASWTADCRQAYSEGKKKADLPVFPVGKFMNPNAGLLSRSAHEAADDAHSAAREAGTKPPALLPRYNPVLVDSIIAMNCQSLRRGAPSKHPKPPKNWDEKSHGSWYHEWEDEDGNPIQEASGWHFDQKADGSPKMPRRCHAERAEVLIDEPDKAILTFGNNRYVVGMGTHDKAAVFLVHQTSHGNYRAGDVTRKRMSLAGSDIRNIIFKIEDRPNNGGGFTVKGAWADVAEMVYMPGQVLTAGYLYDAKGKPLDAKAIRALDADTKGLRFKALDEPIVGKVIPWSKLWPEIQIANRAAIKKMRERGGRSEEYEAGSTQTKSITNICVHGKRVDPKEATPYGMRGSQSHVVAFMVASGEGKPTDGHFGMGVVIGARANASYNVGVHAAKGETEEAETPAPKAKAKAPKSKASKAKAAKPKDAAPPVESDTAEDEAANAEEVDTVVANAD